MIGPQGKFDLRVQAIGRETPTIVSILLTSPDQGDLRPVTPGAHIDLWLPGGVVRQYALCGDTRDRSRYRIAVAAIPGGRASTYVHNTLKIGDIVQATGPRNQFALERASSYVFIAGDIGIASILPMIKTDPGNWRLHYFHEAPAQAAFLDELDDPRVILHDSGYRDLSELLAGTNAETRIYCCGPESLMDAARYAMSRIAPRHMKFEHYEKRTIGFDITPTPIEVHCVRSNMTITVPADRTILDMLLAAGLNLARSCRDGNCATCAVRVIKGIPDHRDSVLSQAQRNSNRVIMICVSRAKSPDLILDI